MHKIQMVNFATYNVRGIGENMKRNKIFKYHRDKYHDIIFIQESHSTKKMEKIWHSQWGGGVQYFMHTTLPKLVVHAY